MDSRIPPSFFPSASRIVCDIVSFQHFEHMWLVLEDLSRRHKTTKNKNSNDTTTTTQQAKTGAIKQIQFRAVRYSLQNRIRQDVTSNCRQVYNAIPERSVNFFYLTRLRQKNQNRGGRVRKCAGPRLKHHRGQPYGTNDNAILQSQEHLPP